MGKRKAGKRKREAVEIGLRKGHLVLAIALTLFVSAGALSLLSQPQRGEDTDAALDAAEKAVRWINAFFESRGISASATLVSASWHHGLVEINVRITTRDGESEVVTHYVTADGTLLFPQAIDITKLPAAGRRRTGAQIPKSDRPEVELFVMSYCPYGIQAEKAIIPVVELLGDRISFTVRFVDYVMHGPEEMWENLRQYCIEHRVAPDKYIAYLKCFVQSGEYRKCLLESGINEEDVNACMEELSAEYEIEKLLRSGQRFPAFPLDAALNDRYGVRGSPTLVINGTVVPTPRSPEGLKNIICSAFTSPPPECNVALSPGVERPGFGPMGETGGGGGSCG